MINIVDFWEKQIALWNAEQKCGFCWEFGAPLTESAVTLQQPEPGKECCVQVLLVRDKITPFSTSNTYNSSALITQKVCTTGFQLLFLLPSTVGTNNYNEINGHPTIESKWANILQKLEACISCDAELAFCTILGSMRRITTWSGQQLINYTPENYSGYRLTVNFQTFM